MIFTKNNPLIPMQRGLIIIFLVLLISTTGCTGINRFLNENVLSSPESSAQEKLDKAREAMRDKRYKKAERLYESLVQTKQKIPVIQEARYGLASISLLTANNLAQYREGLHAMQLWARNSNQNDAEDPRYLLPLLEKRSQTLEELQECRLEDLQECRKNHKACQKRITELEETHNATLTKLQELRRERNQLRREQKELRQKIRELENLYNELLDTRKNL